MGPDQALVSLLSGLLGDNLNRIRIVAAGTFLWGAMTAAIALSTTLAQARLLHHSPFMWCPVIWKQWAVVLEA